MAASKSTSKLKELKERLTQLESSIQALETALNDNDKRKDSPLLKWGLFVFAGIGCVLGVYNYHVDSSNAKSAANHRRVDSDKHLDDAWNLLGRPESENQTVVGIVKYTTDEEKLHEAQRLIRYAITIDPTNPRGYDKLGCYFRALGQQRNTSTFNDDAIRAFRQAIATDNKYVQAYNHLGNTLQEIGQWKEAIENYREAVRRDPEHPIPTYNLACALQENGELDEAIEYFRKAIELNGTNAAAYGRLGDTLKAKGNVHEAEEARRRAAEIRAARKEMLVSEPSSEGQ